MNPHSTTLADLRRIAEREGQRGRVAIGEVAGGRLAPWQEAARVPVRPGSRKEGPNEALIAREDATVDGLIAKLHEGLPPAQRVGHSERYRILTERLLTEALRSYKAHGRVVWPRSIQDELTALGWRSGHPDFWAQVEALARHYIIKAANRQKEKDTHKVALDHAGHYSA